MSSVDKIRAVFDCNTYLQAALKQDSPAGSCYKLAEEGIIKLFVSLDVLAELEDVINRSKIKSRFVNLTDEKIEDFLTSVKETAELVKNVPKVFALPRDVDDEPYVNLAAECEADFIVTRDKDLIDLMTNYAVESKMFRQKFRPLKIVQPLEFLRIVEDRIKQTAVEP